MSEEFLEMDDWTSERIALFKEEVFTSGEEDVLESIALPSPPLIAEGDSWFDYPPGTDIIDCLRKHYHYKIINYAHAGDTLENMIYGTRINNRFERVSPTIDRVLWRLGRIKPKVFLFSGGGNDVAGDEFESYLNHKDSGLALLREAFIENMINNVFRKYFHDLINKVAAVSPETNIVVHGYGHTHPTGKGVDILFFTFAGPWLRPALAKKGVFDFVEQRRAVATLINAYNALLAELSQKYATFHYVDLRPIIDPANDWVNELHLRNSAYARVAKLIHEKIESLI